MLNKLLWVELSYYFCYLYFIDNHLIHTLNNKDTPLLKH